jgi:hypothetical protein
MKETSPVSQLGNFVDRPWGVSEIGGRLADPGFRAGAGGCAQSHSEARLMAPENVRRTAAFHQQSRQGRARDLVQR